MICFYPFVLKYPIYLHTGFLRNAKSTAKKTMRILMHYNLIKQRDLIYQASNWEGKLFITPACVKTSRSNYVCISKKIECVWIT